MNQSGVHPNSRAAVAESNRRRAAARATERLAKPVVVDGSLIAQAKAERGTGAPLVVESLEEKLARLIPGAFVEASPSGLGFAPPPPHERWQVRQRGEFAMRTLAVGPTPREAIARAIFLFGGGR